MVLLRIIRNFRNYSGAEQELDGWRDVLILSGMYIGFAAVMVSVGIVADICAGSVSALGIVVNTISILIAFLLMSLIPILASLGSRPGLWYLLPTTNQIAAILALVTIPVIAQFTKDLGLFEKITNIPVIFIGLDFFWYVTRITNPAGSFHDLWLRKKVKVGESYVPSQKEIAVEGWVPRDPYEEGAITLKGLRRRPQWQDAQANSDNACASVIYEDRFSSERGCALPVPANERLQRTLFPHFIRCSCCTDQHTSPVPLDMTTDLEQGEQGLGQGPYSDHHSSEGAQARYDQRLHQRCRLCSHMCQLIAKRPSKDAALFSGHVKYRDRIGYLFDHWPTPAGLVESAENCHLCALMLSQLNQEQLSALTIGDLQLVSFRDAEILASPQDREAIELRYANLRMVRVRWRAVLPEDNLALIPHFGAGKVPRAWHRQLRGFPDVRLSTQSEQERPFLVAGKWRDRDGRRPISTSTGSNDSVATIQRFLLETTAMKKVMNTFLPTRLISVSAARLGTVQLVHREEVKGLSGVNPTYAALSYCWGPNPSFKVLTQRTMWDFVKGIPVDSLSLTLQQAISVAQRLGYLYIWIDCLCIIQDSASDWAHEAQRMAEVYRNASFTIVSASAWAGDESFFVDQTPLSLQAFPISKQEAILPNVWDERLLQLSDLNLSMWNSRGWCYQERLLSQKIVYFGARQLIFERKLGKGICDFFKAERGSQSSWWHGDRIRVGSEWTSDVYEELVSFEAALCHIWWDLVRDYSSKTFTKPSDRLPAIAGLAKILQDEISLHPEISSGYIAGLWRANVIKDLLWYVSGTGDGVGSSMNPAPSWSWVSRNAPIENASRDLYQPASDLDIVTINISTGSGNTPGADPLLYPEAQSLDADAAAAVSLVSIAPGTSITVKGKLRNMKWTPTPSDAARSYYAPPLWEPEVIYASDEATYHVKRHASSPENIENGLSEQFYTSISSDKSKGPLVHDIRTENDIRVGWFIPDGHEELPSALYFLKINAEPQTIEEHEDPFLAWSVRGFVLTPARTKQAVKAYEVKGKGKASAHDEWQNRDQPDHTRPVYSQHEEDEVDHDEQQPLLPKSKSRQRKSHEDGKAIELIDQRPLWTDRLTARNSDQQPGFSNVTYPSTYRRVGYFELIGEDSGLRWPDVVTGPLSRRGTYYPIRNPPKTDPHNVFGYDCPEREITIF